MTRVEKFHQYREEIANMKVEEFSTKKVAAQKIDEIRNSKASSKLAYDEIMSAYDLFNPNAKKEKNPYRFRFRIGQVIYFICALIVILTLLVLLIHFARGL